MDTEQPTKESTILSLSQDIAVALVNLQGRLDNEFNRSPKCEEEGKAANPMNVLDEILNVLAEDRAHLNRITVFISTEVLPKIN